MYKWLETDLECEYFKKDTFNIPEVNRPKVKFYIQ